MSFDDADALYAEARAMAERIADDGLLMMVVHARGVELFVQGEQRRAEEIWREGARLAGPLPDPGMRAIAYLALAIIYGYLGPLKEGFRYAEEAERATGGDATLGQGILGYSPLVRTVHFGAELLASAGRLERARAEAERALELAKSRFEMFTVAWTSSLLARLADLQGHAPAPALVAEAASLADDPGDLAVRTLALQALGHAALASGDGAAAIQNLQRALNEAHEHGLWVNEVSTRSSLARAQLLAGDANASETAGVAVATARREGAHVSEVIALCARARTLRALGWTADAQADLTAAMGLIKETGALAYEPFIYEEQGRLHDDETELGKALRLYRQIGASGHARRLEAEFSTGFLLADGNREVRHGR